MKTNKKINLAGMSFPESITFIGNEGSSVVDTNDYKLPPMYIKDKSYTLYKKVRNIPIIRGYTFLIDLFLSMIRALFKNVLLLFLLIIILSFVFLQPKEVVVTKETKPGPLSGVIPDVFWDKYFFDIAFFGFLIIFVFLATKNHAAEHKAISAYETSQNLSLNNIRSQPKENCRCGTVLVVWYWILALPLSLFLDTTKISSLVSLFIFMTVFSLAYEIFRLAKREDKTGKFIYFPGWLGQKLTTREPDDKLLLRSREGLMRLLDEERFRYRK